MATREEPRNSFSTETVGDIDASVRTITVLSVTGLPTTGYVRLLLGTALSGEIIGVTLNGTTTLTLVDRGIEGTTAVSHVTGTAAHLYLTVGMLDHLIGVYDETGALTMTCRDVKIGPGLQVASVSGTAYVTIRSVQTYQGDVQTYDGEVVYY
jgi:hypothetical protein